MKKLLALIMALAMIMSLAACGSSSSGSDESAAPAEDAAATEEAPAEEEAAPAEEEAAPAEEEAAPAGENAVLKIGGLVNVTGWFATYDYNNSLEMQCLADYYNNQGGIQIGDTTYTIEVDVQDGQSDAAGIRSAAQLLVDDGCQYVIETNDFWVEGALDIFESNNVMNIMSQNNLDFNATGPDVPHSYSFYNAAPAQFTAALQFLKDQYPEATKVVYCCDDNGSNDAQAALVKAVCEEKGLEYIDSPIVFDAESTDFSAVALQLMQTGADAWIGNGSVTNTGSIAKELRNNGSDMVTCGVLGANVSMMIEAAGLSDFSRAFTMGSDTSNPDNNTAIFNEIFNLFTEEYGEDTAASWCGASIENMYVLLQLMQGAGSIEVDDVMAYYDTIDSVETLFGTGVKGGTETFGNDHIVSYPNSITYAENGESIYGGTVECMVP